MENIKIFLKNTIRYLVISAERGKHLNPKKQLKLAKEMTLALEDMENPIPSYQIIPRDNPVNIQTKPDDYHKYEIPTETPPNKEISNSGIVDLIQNNRNLAIGLVVILIVILYFTISNSLDLSNWFSISKGN